MQVSGISGDYPDLFCQFRFLNLEDEVFSTEPAKNLGKGTSASFYHVQNFTVKVDEAFISYLQTLPMVFELYGHYQPKPPLISQEAKSFLQPIKRKFPSMLLPISEPMPSTKFVPCAVHSSTSPIFNRFDLLAWFEIQELSPSGEYVPLEVDHSLGIPGTGTFLLHQGIQRRLGFTVVLEDDSAMIWRDVKELMVGRIRKTLDWRSTANDGAALSLNLLPAHYIKPNHDERIYFRFEAAWDSSLHNSPLLNCITPYGEKVFFTISAYLEVEDCLQPVCFTKDLCVVISSRDSRFSPNLSLCSIFNQRPKTRDYNKVTGVYELILKHRVDIDSPGLLRRQRRVLDTSATYVRGEENLQGWRPRGDSIIWDHQLELDTLTRLAMTEKSRFLVYLKEKLCDTKPVSDLTKPDKDICNKSHQQLNKTQETKEDCAEDDNRQGQEADVDKSELMSKCLKLLMQKHILERVTSTGQMTSSCLTDMTMSSSCFSDSASSNLDPSEMMRSTISSEPADGILSASPSKGKLVDSSVDGFGSAFLDSTSELKLVPPARDAMDGGEPHFIPEVTEIRANPVVSRKGYLRVEDDDDEWMKRWVVVRRPYIYIYKNEWDAVARNTVNLGYAKVDLPVETAPVVDEEKNCFIVTTAHKRLRFQTTNDEEFGDWLYAVSPLLAGQIRSKKSRASAVTLA